MQLPALALSLLVAGTPQPRPRLVPHQAPAIRMAPLPINRDGAVHEWAHVKRNVSNLGAMAVFNVWQPQVAPDTVFSLAQMWISRGGQTVEAGVQVSPSMYGDRRPHLFVYSTSNGYHAQPHQGCYNRSCGRFVQVSTRTVVGRPLLASSSTDGTQVETEIGWVNRPDGWWLHVDGEAVGYYPRALFAAGHGLADHADTIDFGGELATRRGGTSSSPHTVSEMGSGAPAAAGRGRAAYVRAIRYLDAPEHLVDATGLSPQVSNPRCYTVSPVVTDATWGTHFFFGGSGASAECQAPHTPRPQLLPATPQVARRSRSPGWLTLPRWR